jgi:hypothetical protein
VAKDENFVDEIQDMKMFREMGIHAWIGRNLIHDEIITHIFEY